MAADDIQRDSSELSATVIPGLAVAGFLLMILLAAGPEGPPSVLGILRGATLVFAIAGVIALALHRSLGAYASRVFYLAMIARILVLAFFYLTAPNPIRIQDRYISVPTILVWFDDVHYVGSAEYILESNVSLGNVFGEGLEGPYLPKVNRIGWIISIYKQLFGESQLWVRLAHVILGSLTAAFVVMSVYSVTSKSGLAFATALVVIGPEFIQSSILLYKECYVHLATAIVLFGSSLLLRERPPLGRAAAYIIPGLALFWWSREEGFLLTAALVLTSSVVLVSRPLRRHAFLISAWVLALVVIAGLLTLGPTSQEIVLGMSEAAQLQGVSFGWASSLTGVARAVHILLSIANPPPFHLHLLPLVSPGDGEWFRMVFIELRTLQWWWMLPWLIMGIVVLRTKASALAPLVLPYLALFALAPLLYNGVGPETVRYRDSFLPSAVLLAVAGHEYAPQRLRRLVIAVTYGTGLAIWFFMNFR